jgi:Na+-translocating ferredoxin:NAD+ oxidoreductase RnfD subunit
MSIGQRSSDGSPAVPLGSPDPAFPEDLEAVPAELTNRSSARRALSRHSGTSRASFHALHIPSVLVPLGAGLIAFGWRSAVAVGITVSASILFGLVWRLVGQRGRWITPSTMLWLGLLLVMLMPAELADWRVNWTILAAAGGVLAMVLWLLGGPSGRVHPVVIAVLVVAALFPKEMTPKRVLPRWAAIRGDLLTMAPASPGSPGLRQGVAPWWRMPVPEVDRQGVIVGAPASRVLTDFTRSSATQDGTWISMEQLVRDRLPPLEDLMFIGQPGPLGAASAAAVVAGGLFLIYRRLIDHRLPLYGTVGFIATMMLFRLPVLVTETGPVYTWAAFSSPHVGGPLATTFAAYELVAGPLLFVLLFIAGSPVSRPMARRARLLYALLIGSVAAVFQIYVSVALGPLLAMALVNLITPNLDWLFRPRTMA